MKTSKPIYVVLGTRAQTIKMAPVMRELESRNIPFTLLYTQQHKVTIDDLLDNFEIKTRPVSIIKRKEEAKSLKLFAGWMIQMLLAIYGRIHGQKVMHVESGLRSFNLMNPFPEEIQRLISFRFSHYYVAPNEWALSNLKKYKGEKINSGANTMYESLTYIIKKKNPKVLSDIKKEFKLPEKFALVSIHRYENIFKEERFKEILSLLDEISKKIKLVFVLHPPTEKVISSKGYSERLNSNKNITLIPRQDFQRFAYITDLAEFVITDGGSNQEELSYMGKPTILFREYTERTEGLDENVLLSKFDHETIFNFVENYKKFQRKPLDLKVTPSRKIVDFVLELT